MMRRLLVGLLAAGISFGYTASSQAATYNFSYDPADILMGAAGVSSVEHEFDVTGSILDLSTITGATLAIYLNDSNPGVLSMMHANLDEVDGQFLGISLWGEGNHVATYINPNIITDALTDNGFFNLNVDSDLGFTLPFAVDNFNYDKAVLTVDTSEVPLPGAVWLLGSGLAGLIAYRKKN